MSTFAPLTTSCALVHTYASPATATRDDEWIQSQVDMLKIAFEELALERGEVINILGITVHMER